VPVCVRVRRSVHPIARFGCLLRLPSFLVSAVCRFIRSQSAVRFLSYAKRIISCLAAGSFAFPLLFPSGLRSVEPYISPSRSFVFRFAVFRAVLARPLVSLCYLLVRALFTRLRYHKSTNFLCCLVGPFFWGGAFFF